MNYEKHYKLLIEKSKNRVLDFKERHHILPKCMGGTDDPENIAELTPEEHYVAHQLLVKIYPDNSKLIYAAQMMNMGRNNNKIYGWIKRRYSEAVSKNQTGDGNSQHGTQWICNFEMLISKKIPKSEPIPTGWIKGRNKWKNCKHCSKAFLPNAHEKYCSDVCKNEAKEPRIFSEESKNKMSERAKERAKNNPSTVGKNSIWITNGKENKRIINNKIPDGWYKGRIMSS